MTSFSDSPQVRALLATLTPAPSTRALQAERQRYFEGHAYALGSRQLPAVREALHTSLRQVVGRTRAPSLRLDRIEEFVDSQAMELGQLLLSNWMSTLEHALDDKERILVLDAQAWPISCLQDSREEGVLAFPLAPPVAMGALHSYRDSLLPTTGSVLLSPSLELFRSADGEWSVARPHGWQE
jgi:hypothetical protein